MTNECDATAHVTKETRFRVVVVRWQDACGDGLERKRAHLPKPFIVTTVGALIVDDENYVVVAQDIYYSDKVETEYRTTMAIPRRMILSIEDIGHVAES